MNFLTKLVLLLCVAHISFLAAMKKEDFDLIYKDEYIIDSYYGCIPKLIIKNKVILVDKENNTVMAEARYFITYFSSTAELKKAHTWFKNSDIRDIFLLYIIEDIKKHYPRITRLEYSHGKTAWDFK